ncbi:hypothetical protein CYMTET_9978 [Cymbomonas tetramitiformis]|uniref:Plastid lipid-associated protein/fibrillin conserved domain-containing protein n=1 Tax=Cymbomonas tetramitiformis TaxID=36881 RepID=A0AAE0GQP2_9CHLO|nr:hypothetical protein CYMTET_9978 [Cymbomonas tetramitiformis]
MVQTVIQLSQNGYFAGAREHTLRGKRNTSSRKCTPSITTPVRPPCVKLSVPTFSTHSTYRSIRRDSKCSSARNADTDSLTVSDAEERTLAITSGMSARGQKATPEEQAELATALAVLEEDGGEIESPVSSAEIEGNWTLLYTSKSQFDIRNPLGRRVDGTTPGIEGVFEALFGKSAEALQQGIASSSSPIQRTITSIDAVTVRQDIRLKDTTDPRVDQMVLVGDVGFLRLSAAASAEGDRRINFTFDLAYFEFNSLPFPRIPYPVPFKLLGDEAKGWLDTLYLSPKLRVTRGNKGTVFVLKKVD